MTIHFWRCKRLQLMYRIQYYHFRKVFSPMHSFLFKKGKKALAFCNKSSFCRHFFRNENRKNLASCRAARFMKTAHPIFPHDIFKKSDLLNATTDNAQCGSITYILHSMIEKKMVKSNSGFDKCHKICDKTFFFLYFPSWSVQITMKTRKNCLLTKKAAKITLFC